MVALTKKSTSSFTMFWKTSILSWQNIEVDMVLFCRVESCCWNCHTTVCVSGFEQQNIIQFIIKSIKMFAFPRLRCKHSIFHVSCEGVFARWEPSCHVSSVKISAIDIFSLVCPYGHQNVSSVYNWVNLACMYTIVTTKRMLCTRAVDYTIIYGWYQ